jgi:hypothetical protein
MNAYARRQTARAEATRLAALLGSEHSAMADFILALADFDAARGWAELGHPSLWSNPLPPHSTAQRPDRPRPAIPSSARLDPRRHRTGPARPAPSPPPEEPT